MQTLCYKIRLKENSLERAKKWAQVMNQRSKEVIATLKLEGVFVESVFLDSDSDGDYLIYFIKAKDLNFMRQFSKNSTLAIEDFHKTFKRDTFAQSKTLEALIDFDLLSENLA